MRFPLFCALTLSDWLENSRHFLNQSEVEPKPIVTRSRTFSRAGVRFLRGFHWFILLSVYLAGGITLVLVYDTQSKKALSVPCNPSLIKSKSNEAIECRVQFKP